MSDTLVIVVTFNGMKWVESCVGSVSGSAHPADLIVIDNASSDGTAQWLEEHSESLGFTYRQTGANIGFGAANNIGLRHALEHGYRYIYLLNQDAWLNRDTLSNLISAIGDSEECRWGIVSPVQTQADGTTPDRNFAKHCAGVLDHGQAVAEVKFVMAAHWLMTRECVETVGGFSPAFRLYGEDDDYINRARYHGFRIGVAPKASAVHDRGSRPNDKARRMRLKLIGCRARACNPKYPFLPSFISQLFLMTGMAVKNLSLQPIRSMPSFMDSYGEMKDSRKKARGIRAFLTEK